MIRILSQLLSAILIGLVWGYRYLIRPILPQACRFEPSCSEYMIQAIHKYGPIRGTAKGIWRICRCHPFNPGGYDPP